jgi:hypothetical protein
LKGSSSRLAAWFNNSQPNQVQRLAEAIASCQRIDDRREEGMPHTRSCLSAYWRPHGSVRVWQKVSRKACTMNVVNAAIRKTAATLQHHPHVIHWNISFARQSMQTMCCAHTYISCTRQCMYQCNFKLAHIIAPATHLL